MTAPAPPPAPPADTGLTGYAAASLALSAASAVEATRLFDQVAPEYVTLEDLAAPVRRVLLAALVAHVVATNRRARALASRAVASRATVETRTPVPPPTVGPSLPAEQRRLTAVVTAVLDNAEKITDGVPPGDRVSDLAAAAPGPSDPTQPSEPARASTTAPQRALPRPEPRPAPAPRARLALTAGRTATASGPAMSVAATHHATAGPGATLSDEEKTARRRAAQRARVARLARSESADAGRQAILDAAERVNTRLAGIDAQVAAELAAFDRQLAAEAVADAADTEPPTPRPGPPFLGWIRDTNGDACRFCLAWADGLVRPLKTRMKSHTGCVCTARLVTSRNNHEFTRAPEVTVSRSAGGPPDGSAGD